MTIVARRRFTPFSLTLEKTDSRGPAQGVAVLRADLAARIDVLAARAERYPHLQLSLLADAALLWSPEPKDLPWFPKPLWHLAAPKQRIFAPLGWRLATPRFLLPACLAMLERDAATRPPLALTPPQGDGSTRVIDLGRSAAAPNVDWRALARTL